MATEKCELHYIHVLGTCIYTCMCLIYTFTSFMYILLPLLPATNKPLYLLALARQQNLFILLPPCCLCCHSGGNRIFGVATRFTLVATEFFKSVAGYILSVFHKAVQISGGFYTFPTPLSFSKYHLFPD